MQQFLYFFPLPHGQGSFLLTLGIANPPRVTVTFVSAYYHSRQNASIIAGLALRFGTVLTEMKLHVSIYLY